MKPSPPLGIGIDVSKNTLDVVFLLPETSLHFVVPNNKSGIKILIKKCSFSSSSSFPKIVMESTGRYHLLCALLLSSARLDVRVINPLLARRYLSSAVRKVKTDKADALVLAQVAQFEKRLPKPFSATKTDILIRQKMGLLTSLEKQIQTFQAVLRNYSDFQDTLELSRSMTEQTLLDSLKTIQKQREHLEGEISQLIAQQKGFSHSQKILQSIPGISAFTASLLLFLLDTSCQNPKQWVAFCGLDISVRQSGTWKGRGKLTKRGNSYVRKRLFHSAWGAMMTNPDFRSYYDSLRQAGHSYVESLLIISRKLLRISFALLQKNIPFDSSFSLFS